MGCVQVENLIFLSAYNRLVSLSNRQDVNFSDDLYKPLTYSV